MIPVSNYRIADKSLFSATLMLYVGSNPDRRFSVYEYFVTTTLKVVKKHRNT